MNRRTVGIVAGASTAVLVVAVLGVLVVSLSSRVGDRDDRIDELDERIAELESAREQGAVDLASARATADANASRWLAGVAVSTQYSPRVSRLIALEALRRSPTIEARAALGSLVLADPRADAPITELAHSGAVWAVDMSIHGTLAATGSDDGTVGIWSVSTGDRMVTLTHDDGVRDVELTEGDLVVSGSLDGSARAWRTDGTALARIDHTDRVNEVAAAADGSLMASASHDGSVIVADPRTGERLLDLEHGDIVWAVAVSSAGDRAASGTDGGLTRLWSLPDGELIAEVEHSGPVEVVDFSPDGRWLFAGGQGGVLHVVDAASGEIAFSPDRGGAGSVIGVGWHPDSGEVAVAALSDGITRFAVPDGEVIAQHRQSGGTRGVSYGPDGSWLVGISGDFQFSFGEISFWDPVSARRLAQVNLGGPVESVAVDPDGASIVAGFRTTVNQVETGSAFVIAAEPEWEGIACVDSDGVLPESVLVEIGITVDPEPLCP